MNTPLICLIVTCQDAEDIIDSTLRSILLQTREDFAAYVISDGSSDRTGSKILEYEKHDPRIRPFVFEKRFGTAHHRNTFVRDAYLTTSFIRYYLFLDGGDTLTSDALEVLVDALEKNPDSPAAHGRSSYINRAGKPLTKNLPFRYGGNLRRKVQGSAVVDCEEGEGTGFSAFVYRHAALSGATLLRKEAVMQMEGFVEDLVVYSDWLLFATLSRHNPFTFIDKVIHSHRLPDFEDARVSKLYRESAREVRRRLTLLPDMTPEERRMTLLCDEIGRLLPNE